MIKIGHHVFYIRERGGAFLLVDDSCPDLEHRLLASNLEAATDEAWVKLTAGEQYHVCNHT